MTPLEVAFRVAVAVFVIVAPTLMFLGFWRLLLRMRNGELVERVMSDERIDEQWSSGEFAQPSVLSMIHPSTSSGPGCPHCGASNLPEARYCASCLRRL